MLSVGMDWRIRLLLIAWIGIFFGICNASAPSSVSPGAAAGLPEKGVPALVLFDPVDLDGGRADSGFGDFLRGKLLASGKWRVGSRMEMEKKLGEFGWDPAKTCHEFQCGFDAGNVLLTDYVLFGTITSVAGIYAYSFNLLHVPTSQVVASEVGNVPRNPGKGGDDPLLAKLAAFASGLDPARLDKSKALNRALMAVVDLNAESVESRVLAERVGTHVYASRHYDLMSQTELHELLSAMNISLAAAGNTDSSMLALGNRLNVAYLVQSQLSPGPRGNAMALTLFDVAGKHRIRAWSLAPTQDFQDILHLEKRFFTTLLNQPMPGQPENPLAAQNTRARHGSHSVWKRGFFSAAGITLATGLTYLAYSTRQEANGAHMRAESAYSAESALGFKQKVRDEDRLTLLYGSLAALTLGASVTLWTF